ncbi:GNAT family N-acetyltransferase [Paracoccus aurantiacus]|uniref:GNAT family N-acetyltransferase n=1 Tax=Paracoccus aurantiacus TaxID=2599412 RepID=A0A5C6RZJ5_9RHOB|nr:GNAT family N-acetyltransferase [Paracoccus aurantiacus]TXB67507.1 GNAT family N-acetyltransferase [Paracoccus aurantiacus]
MTPMEMARIHAASFTRPRPWGTAEFAALLADPASFAISVDQGFILGRTVIDEAELLTLAVAPTDRRRGVGRALLTSFEAEARRRGALAAFLEVASDNTAAQALYVAHDWQEAGRRRNYYGTGIDGLVMRKEIALP